MARPAVTLAVVVWSGTPFAPVTRTMSPGRMSGVTPVQQPPPGWLTSTMPSNTPGVFGSSTAATGVDLLTVVVPRTTSTVYVPAA